MYSFPIFTRTTARLATAVSIITLACAAFAQPPPSASLPDVIVADFEAETYGTWKVEGEAFGSGPASGTLPGQQSVSGFEGKRLVNSFHNGDRTTGSLTSPAFTIERPWLNFLIGGGGHPGVTCMNLVIDGQVILSATGPNTKPGGREDLQAASWNVAAHVGKTAVLQIVDQHKGGWGHINVDHIVQSDAKSAPVLVPLEKTLLVSGSHLIVPISNLGRSGQALLLGLYEGEKLVQSFNVVLPRDDDPHWLAAYPLSAFGLQGRQMRIAPVDGVLAPEALRASFDQIRIGSASEALKADDYAQPYRNQFHASTRRGWTNDPNGMVFHDGVYHLYYQHNPFGIQWGNMHWGHFTSTDLIHWEEKPITLLQKTVKDMAFSGGGFVDFNNSAGLGKDTLFIAFTSTGRGECLAYSKDGGITFTELPENPVVTHKGRDPKILWYVPENKWVMAVYNNERCAETDAIPPAKGTEKHALANIAFWESKNLRQWTRTGAFTDADRDAVYECPEWFPLPVPGNPGETRWILLGAQNRYYIGHFDGKTFIKESGPHGTRHGAFYAAQTFNDIPDGRRIQIGWLQTDSYHEQFPDQIANQAFTLPHELTLRQTDEGLRVAFSPVAETEKLRGEILAEGKDLTMAQAHELLQKCQRELSEVLIEFSTTGPKNLVINGIEASFQGSKARIFTDRTVNEVYAEDGLSYEIRKLPRKALNSPETRLTPSDNSTVRSLKIYRLKSIWNTNNEVRKWNP